MWMKSFILAFFSPLLMSRCSSGSPEDRLLDFEGGVTESQVITIFFSPAAWRIFYILSQNSLLSNVYVLQGSWKEWSSVNTHTHHSKQKQKASERAYDRSWKLLITYLQATITTGKYSEYVRTATAAKNEGQGWSPETSRIPRQQTHPLWYQEVQLFMKHFREDHNTSLLFG